LGLYRIREVIVSLDGFIRPFLIRLMQSLTGRRRPRAIETAMVLGERGRSVGSGATAHAGEKERPL
jgi:hypothetical protein